MAHDIREDNKNKLYKKEIAMSEVFKPILSLALTYIILISNPIHAIAATSFQDVLNDGSIYAVGSVRVARYSASKVESVYQELFC